MIQAQTRVVANPQRMSRKQTALSKTINSTAGTVRTRHLWVPYGTSWQRNPYCKWCGAMTQDAAPRCVEVAQAVRQAMIREYRENEGLRVVQARKDAHKARRLVERAQEEARHAAKQRG